MCREVLISRDKAGFLKCQDCSRRFLTHTGFEIHLNDECKKDSETKVDQLQQSPTNKAEITFQQNSRIEENCPLGSLTFPSENDLPVHTSNEHIKISQCSKCKKLLDFDEKEFQNKQKNCLTVCQECDKSFFDQHAFNTLIKSIQIKLAPYQCQECKKYFSRNTNLKLHINTVHRRLTPFKCCILC